MKTIPASAFKARCLKLMDEVCASREPLLITKNGRPVAQLVAPPQVPDEFFGRMRGRLWVIGDIESPVDPAEAWEGSFDPAR